MKILLAEDDPSIQAIAVMALTKIGGHSVELVDNGLEVLSAAKGAKPDLILLDVMMPELDGFETCARLKRDGAVKGVPIIFLTAKAQMYEMQHGMSLGAIGYILKPFDPMAIHKQIEEILKNHAKAA